MTASAIAAAPRPLRLWRQVTWSHPELWLLAPSLLAWLLLFREHGLGLPALASGHEHHHHVVAAATASMSFVSSALSEMRAWVLMTGAMMLPMVFTPARVTAERSLWHRRGRAIVVFVSAYLGVWLLLGAGVSVAFAALGLDGLPQPAFGAGVLILAGLWQVVPARRRFALACHRTMPLAPRGWRADRDCARYGLTIAGACVLSCGPAMLACMAAGHTLAPMLALTAVGLSERYLPRPSELLLAGLPLLMALQLAFTPLITT